MSQNILLATLTVSNRHSWEWWILFLSPKKHNRKDTEQRRVLSYHGISTASWGWMPALGERCKVPLTALPRSWSVTQ